MLAKNSLTIVIYNFTNCTRNEMEVCLLRWETKVRLAVLVYASHFAVIESPASSREYGGLNMGDHPFSNPL